MITNISVDKETLKRFCMENRIRKLMFFGSVLRDDFSPESDIDVIVEFEAGASVGMIKLARLERELSEIMGRKVDLNTEGFLSPYFKDEVLREATTQYVSS